MSNIDEIISSINKKHKEEFLKHGLEIKKFSRIDFTSPRANFMLRGGIPEGTMIEFAGLASSGKTTTALDVCANAQTIFSSRDKMNKILYVDLEGTLEGVWASQLGVNVKDLFVYVPEKTFAEIILDRVKELIESGLFGLIVFDSIEFLVPEANYAKDYGENVKIGGISTLWTRFIKDIAMLQNKMGFTFIAMNCPKNVIGGYPGQTYHPGGSFWERACSVQIIFSKGSTWDKDGKEQPASYPFPVAHKVVMSLRKAKKGIKSDRKLTYYVLRYEEGKEGVDYILDTIDFATLPEFNLIEKRASWYAYKDLKVQGLDALVKHFRQNYDDFMEIYNQIMELVKK